MGTKSRERTGDFCGAHRLAMRKRMEIKRSDPAGLHTLHSPAGSFNFAMVCYGMLWYGIIAAERRRRRSLRHLTHLFCAGRKLAMIPFALLAYGVRKLLCGQCPRPARFSAPNARVPRRRRGSCRHRRCGNRRQSRPHGRLRRQSCRGMHRRAKSRQSCRRRQNRPFCARRRRDCRFYAGHCCRRSCCRNRRSRVRDRRSCRRCAEGWADACRRVRRAGGRKDGRPSRREAGAGEADSAADGACRRIRCPRKSRAQTRNRSDRWAWDHNKSCAGAAP